MDLGLEGRRALVTGASSGIGLAVARRLVAEGVDVVAGSRRSSAELDDLGQKRKIVHVSADLSNEEGPIQLVNTALRGGPLDILINNAGAVTPRLTGFTAVTDEQWSNTMALTLMAAVRTTRAVLPSMIAQGSGSIVNNASVNATLPDPLVIDYSAAKAALVELFEGVVQRSRTARHPSQCRQRRAGLDGTLAGQRRCCRHGLSCSRLQPE